MVFFFWLLCVTACADRSQKKEVVAVGRDASVAAAPDDISTTDSVEIYHYPDPDDQKVFERINTSDPGLIALLAKNLERPDISSEACPHFTKLYLLRKGEVFKTVYVSDSCGYLAYATNGNRVFKQLDTAVANRLKRVK